MVSNSLTFALGPRLLRPGDEDAPDDEEEGEDGGDEHSQDNEEEGENGDAEQALQPGEVINEETSLLPERLVRKTNRVTRKGYKKGHRRWDGLPHWAQETLDIAYQFANAPLLGALAGAFIGLIPALHRLFFNEFNEGGYLNAWLTTSIKNIGDLFASLQIIVVGVKLSQSLLKMKRGEESGPFSWTSFLFITAVRFVIWPL
jgi:auxin efflux carrier family protein